MPKIEIDTQTNAIEREDRGVVEFGVILFDDHGKTHYEPHVLAAGTFARLSAADLAATVCLPDLRRIKGLG